MNCIQILPLTPLMNDLVKSSSKTIYIFKIKDPSFVNVNIANYTFYLGRVHLKALVKCDDSDERKRNDDRSSWRRRRKRGATRARREIRSFSEIAASTERLCAADNTISFTKEVGILKAENTDTTFFHPDLCDGHIMSETCIMRYKPSPSFIIIMHPMPSQFNRLMANLDLATYMNREVENRQFHQSLTDDELRFGTSLKNDTINIRYIASYHRQKYANNLVIKFLNYQGENINYLVGFASFLLLYFSFYLDYISLSILL